MHRTHCPIMKPTWPDSYSRTPMLVTHNSASLGHDEAIQKMLSDLPSFGGFTHFDATLPTDSFVQYLATEQPQPKEIRNETTRSLIRALRAKSDKRDPRREQRLKKRPPPDMPGVVAKRLRWTALDKERKQSCIRVALSAACKHARAGDRVDRLREVWQENPHRKQMINAEVRTALADSVYRWTETELAAYLERAAVSGVVTRDGMIRAVRDHLAPDTGNVNK